MEGSMVTCRQHSAGKELRVLHLDLQATRRKLELSFSDRKAWPCNIQNEFKTTQYLPPSKRTFQTNCTSRPSAEPDKEAGWLNNCKNIVLAVKMTEPTSCQNNISCSQRNNHNKISNSLASAPHWILRKTTNHPDLVARIPLMLIAVTLIAVTDP